MISSRKGVIGLPIKLTVSFLIIALMVPPMLATVDDIRRGMDDSELMDIAEDLADRLSKVSTRGIGYRTHADLLIPDHGYLVLGGDDPTGIRVFHERGLVGRVMLSVPVSGDEIVLSGSILLELGNSEDGESVTVKEL